MKIFGTMLAEDLLYKEPIVLNPDEAGVHPHRCRVS